MFSRLLNARPLSRTVSDANPWEELPCLRCMRFTMTCERVEIGALVAGRGRLDRDRLEQTVCTMVCAFLLIIPSMGFSRRS